MNEYDVIELLMPFKPEYVSVARLATASILSRIGFDIDTIEDIKVGISEVCNIFLNNKSENSDCYSIVYHIGKDYLKIIFKCNDDKIWDAFNNTENEFGLSILNALIDNISYYKKGDGIILDFEKHV